jgi:hypothetical protein
MVATKDTLKGDTMRYQKLLFCCSLTAMISTACSPASSDNTADSTDTTTTTKTTSSDPEKEIEEAITNKLAESVPSALALAIFPQGDSASLRLADDDSDETEVEDPNANKSFAEKVKENKKRLEGEAEEGCIRLNVFKKHKPIPTETCYEFDSDMNPSKFAGKEGTYGTKDGKNSKGEACMVAFARGEVNDSVEAIDQAMEAISGVVCQAKKAKVDKQLGEGESLDLVEALDGVGDAKMKFTEAKLARLDDADDGSAIYRNDIAFTDPRGRTVAVHLLHSPGASGEKGTIWVQMSGEKMESPTGANQPTDQQQAPAVSLFTDPNNTENKNFVMSINYAKETDSDGKPSLSFEMRRAAIVNTVEPFTDDGLVNYAGLADEAQNSEVHAIKYVAYHGNPETGEGDLSYWMNPGGSLAESARGFLFNIKADEEGNLAGCGTSGATANVSIRKALVSPSETNVLKPVRYWHPQEDKNISPDKDERFTANEGFKITQQCFVFDPTADQYAIDTEKTTSAEGYDLLDTAEVKVAPPAAPKKRFEGDVLNKKLDEKK